MRLLLHDNLADRIGRQIRLRQESRGGTCGNEVRNVAWRAGRDQDDHGPVAAGVLRQQVGKIKTALVPEHQVDEDDLRPQLADKLHSFSRCAGSAKDALSLPLKESARNVSE
jgi:hypothetical protein